MCRKLRLLTLLFVAVGWISVTLLIPATQTKPSPKVLILKWPACADQSDCGECEVMSRSGYLLPVCEQNFDCQLLNAIPPVNQLPSSMGVQGLCKEKQMSLYRRKAWSDCNRDGFPDCECWTWYWRDKSDPNKWYIGISCEDEPSQP